MGLEVLKFLKVADSCKEEMRILQLLEQLSSPFILRMLLEFSRVHLTMLASHRSVYHRIA